MQVTLVVSLATQRAVQLALEFEMSGESCLQGSKQITMWRRTDRPRRGLTKRRGLAKIPDGSSNSMLKLLLKHQQEMLQPLRHQQGWHQALG
jgi:hypothetical protein